MTEQLAVWLEDLGPAVVFTGAGMSTESGIPDFRSPGGIWAKYQPVMFADFVQDPAARHEYWRQKSEGHREFAQAHPNPGHRILAAWQRLGLVEAVITQNIDGLHQQAGSQDVLELHGTAREVGCLSCSFRDPVDRYVDDFLASDRVPDCPNCGGPLKHATISFGQNLPRDVLRAAHELCRETRLLLALGSSLTVSPAAELPLVALDAGAKVVIINRTQTAMDDLATLVIHDGLGKTLQAIDEALSGNEL